MIAREFFECFKNSFEKPSMGRAITFPKRVSKRWSVVAVAMKARSSSLCDSEKGCSSLVASREVFSFPIILLSDCNLIFVSD